MRVVSNTKAVSTLVMILLIILSAVVGGIISYMFTIPPYIELPKGTTLTITGVYFDKENAGSFVVEVLNPSYSPANATITRIAVSLKIDVQLYDIVEAVPSIEEGLAVQKGETVNITCLKVQKGGFDVGWGSFASDFAGQTIVVHVFSSDSPAANMEATLPFVKLYIADVTFDPNTSFGDFSMTVGNNDTSEADLTIDEILAVSMELTKISPSLPYPVLRGENASFTCTGNWSSLAKTRTILTISVSTEQAYSFTQKVELPVVDITIQNVTFDENHTDYFNVTVSNFANQATYVNVTKISCALDNGTAIIREPGVVIGPNSTWTLTVDWDWKEYRNRTVNVTAYLLQNSETETFNATTPPPIIVKVLNEKDVFSLQDRTHFNITLQSHRSSIDAINITRIVVKETGELINGTDSDPPLPYGLVEPDSTQAFHCNITDWNITRGAGASLTLTVYTLTNQTSEEHLFEFTFILPTAELNITSIDTVAGAKYLNMTVENLGYSIWNLTISRVEITLPSQTEPLNQTFAKNQIIITPGETAVLLCSLDWEQHKGESITVTVFTDEGVEASQAFQIPDSPP